MGRHVYTSTTAKKRAGRVKNKILLMTVALKNLHDNTN